MTDRREPHLSHDNYSRSRCSVCRSGKESNGADIPRVEALLAAGARLKPTAKKFGIPPFSLRRHWAEVSANRKSYLRFGAQLSREALTVAVHEEKIGSLDHLKIIRAGLKQGCRLSLHSPGSSYTWSHVLSQTPKALLSGKCRTSLSRTREGSIMSNGTDTISVMIWRVGPLGDDARHTPEALNGQIERQKALRDALADNLAFRVKNWDGKRLDDKEAHEIAEILIQIVQDPNIQQAALHAAQQALHWTGQIVIASAAQALTKVTADGV